MIFVDDVVLVGESRDVEVRHSICNVILAKYEVVRP